jgi:hypothetical protein
MCFNIFSIFSNNKVLVIRVFRANNALLNLLDQVNPWGYGPGVDGLIEHVKIFGWIILSDRSGRVSADDQALVVLTPTTQLRLQCR